MANSKTPSDRRKPSRWNQKPVPARVAERAFSRHEVDEAGCWISSYSVTNTGYAQIGWQDNGTDGDRGTVLAHRASWVHVNGQVPIGMTLDHICKTRRCVNPEHLRLLSNYENARRNDGSDWAFGQCRNGHPDSNLREVPRTAKSGRKYMGLACRVCVQENRDRWALKNPDKVASIREAYKESSRKNASEWYQANKQITKDRAKAWKRRKREELST